MSKLFYDHLVNLGNIQREIDKVATSQEEKHELWQIVDEVVHHRVIGCILDNLSHKHHDEFMARLHEAPHDEAILDYLDERIGKSTTDLILKEIENLSVEILEDLQKD